MGSGKMVYGLLSCSFVNGLYLVGRARVLSLPGSPKILIFGESEGTRRYYAATRHLCDRVAARD